MQYHLLAPTPVSQWMSEWLIVSDLDPSFASLLDLKKEIYVYFWATLAADEMQLLTAEDGDGGHLSHNIINSRISMYGQITQNQTW